MRAAHSYSNPQWKSPPHALRRGLPGGGTISYNYERALRPASIERRLAAFRPAPAGLERGAPRLRQRNGGARHRSPGVPHSRPLAGRRLGAAGSALGRLLRDAHRPRRDAWPRLRLGPAAGPGTSSARRPAEARFDLLIAEPVTYDYDMAVLDLDALGRAWSERAPNRMAGVVFDTTLSGDMLPHTKLLAAVAEPRPAFVAVVSSGSKLDQQGLELSNVGLLSLYTPAGRARSAAQIARYLEKLRSSFGTGLSLDELVVLQAPFFLDREAGNRFARAVFESNARPGSRESRAPAASSARSSTPLCSPSPGPAWAVGPFVVLELREEAPENHRLLLAVVQDEARRRGIPLTLGSSFGFRGHRFEAIQPEPMGSKGPLQGRARRARRPCTRRDRRAVRGARVLPRHGGAAPPLRTRAGAARTKARHLRRAAPANPRRGSAPPLRLHAGTTPVRARARRRRHDLPRLRRDPARRRPRGRGGLRPGLLGEPPWTIRMSPEDVTRKLRRDLAAPIGVADGPRRLRTGNRRRLLLGRGGPNGRRSRCASSPGRA